MSSDEYQNSHRSDQTESDTEPSAEDNDIPDDDTASGTRRAHELRKDDKQKSKFRLCEFPPPPDRRGQRQSGEPQLLYDL